MASSSDEALDESFPEMVYKTPSLIDETSCRKEDSFLKCPLCNHSSRCFYCVDCVRNGNFTHSKKKCFDRFADKKPRKYNLDEEKNEIIKKYAEIHAKKAEAENLRFSITLRKEKIDLLRQSIEARKKEIEKDVKSIRVLQEKNQKLKVRHNKQYQKLSRLKELNAKTDSENELVVTKLKSVQSAFETDSQAWICELRNSIFPIIKTLPYFHRNETSTEQGQNAELDEAQKTTYVQGQWVITSSPVDEIHFAVVDALVPSTGDYSLYTNWCASNEPLAIYRGDWAPLQRHQFDSAYGISAGLAYASQLVNVLSYYLDIHLPKKSNFNDFCRYEDVSKFNHQVAKLNANIIHLCLQRQVDVSKLSAHRTICNLQLVFDPQAIESPGTCGIPSTLQEKEDHLESLEDSICKDLLPGEESDDDIEADFEYITTDEVPKADSPAVNLLLIKNLLQTSLEEKELKESGCDDLSSEETDVEPPSDFEFILEEEVSVCHLENYLNYNSTQVREERESTDNSPGLDQQIITPEDDSKSEDNPDVYTFSTSVSNIADGVVSLWTTAASYFY